MFTKMLQKIRLGETDTLYFLGDAVDRGDDPVGVLETMMEHDNIIPVMGNHDLVAASVLEKLEEYDLTEKFATGAANHFPEPGRSSGSGGTTAGKPRSKPSRRSGKATGRGSSGT